MPHIVAFPRRLPSTLRVPHGSKMIWLWPMTCKPIYPYSLCIKLPVHAPNFRFWSPVQIWNDLWPIILCNLKTKHRRWIKLYIFGLLMTRQTIWNFFSEKLEHISIFDPCGTFKVNGAHLGNATICGISENCSSYILVLLWKVSSF